MSVDGVRRLFTSDQFFQMIATGILTKDDHVELLEGEILEMTPIGLGHAACTANLFADFHPGDRRARDRVVVGNHSSIRSIRAAA